MENKLTYSVSEAGRALSVSRGTAYALVRSGNLRSVAVGRRRLVPRTEIDRFLASDGVEIVDGGMAGPSQP